MKSNVLYDLVSPTQKLETSALFSAPSTDSSSTNVSSLLQFTIPDGKLFYPEPFIASPSYLHSDITYLHIFQYWYWLWFMFIFLICFFFISFLSTIRWCTNRVRPRRETRGVSRSKCGDLITACVPVSWAMSIIVNESTDATDLNDGFGTAELVVGVRAYQWGWEYYYPRSIDLNYNVRPSYSTFVGNSLKYNTSSGRTLAVNNLWRMYQNKVEDRVITPAYLMLTPLDSSGALGFLSFKSIGLSTLQESSSFAKIRNATKVYNSHLVHTPSQFVGRYHSIHNLYADENAYLTTTSFGLAKQHNLASSASLGNSFSSTILDQESFNRFLDSNMGIPAKSLTSEFDVGASPLSLAYTTGRDSTEDSTRLQTLLSESTGPSSAQKIALSSYPEFVSRLNSNSDKEGLRAPLSKLSGLSTSSLTLRNVDLLSAQSGLENSSSAVGSHSDATISNQSWNPRVFNQNGPNSKVLLGDQSIRAFQGLVPSKSNFNLSRGLNSTASNLHLSNRSNNSLSPLNPVLAEQSHHFDLSLVSNLGSNRSFMPGSHSAVLSSRPSSHNSLDYDSTSQRTNSLAYSVQGELLRSSLKSRTPVGEVFVGSREKTPRSINTAYWSTFWSTSNPLSRVSSALSANLNRTSFYLPTFSTYADYDFRNDQAIDMLEELFWESSYSGYNFYDYMSLTKESADASVSPKDFSLGQHFNSTSLGSEATKAPLSTYFTKDLSLIGASYSTNVQMEDYLTAPFALATDRFSLLPLYAEVSELDEVFTSYKNLTSTMSKFATPTSIISTAGLSPRSYLSVFNNFRSDFDDFSWERSRSYSTSDSTFATLPSVTSDQDFSDIEAGLSTSSTFDGAQNGLDSRISNPVTLRSSVRNSVVNYNAFQKVFKPRLDEGRAHSQSSSFADLGLKQPFLSDSKVPYLQLLGKNRDSFFETPLYARGLHQGYNAASSLFDALNTPMYDFPFLLARTSDTMRFTWLDWFAKWKHVEVQPSSISRYSTLGVPYLRKPYDFNSNTGDKFQDTELYFTRVARSRRNYLTNWSYSPYLYNRSYIWGASMDLGTTFLDLNHSLSSTQFACNVMGWYWTSPAHLTNLSDTVNFSLSGNTIYNKSTWQPRASIQGYYYNVSRLVDILSKREFLYRRYLENSHSVTHLPSSLCATPNNPLLQELKSSFRFSDPANFSSEFSRDLLYSSADYFKFMYLKTLAERASESFSRLPLNPDLLTDYVFFYFFNTSSRKVSNNLEIYKNQYRPLKKGISSMLRLHATGAVAMPIEIRLQVLASSRDVIHSWAIPSASIKIDCVPGYTSHRMMKFLLTGVYWGQCQEICGRYHHWMPIVVYFMKRDLFFLWCTHFVFSPAQSDTWDISDRRFADFIRFASYDRSTWLSEFGSQ